MKTLHCITLATAFILSNCSIFNRSADQQNLGDSTWTLQTIKQNRVNLAQSAVLRFDEKKSEISGKAACNSFSGDFELIRNLISFSDVISTKMYCEGKMDEENQIMTNLLKISRFEVKSNLLYLYSKDELLLTYKR